MNTRIILTGAILLGIAARAPALGARQSGASVPDTLAQVGASVITSTDLVERVGLMPFPGKEREADRDSLKVRALQSMVAERLLASEATVRGIGFDSLMQLRLDGLERAFVRDQLYHDEVASRVSVTDAEIASGMKRYARELRLALFRCASMESARSLARALRRGGMNIDSLSSAGFERTIISHDTVTVNYGVKDESIEKPAYALTRAQPVSPPFVSPILGWVVLSFLEERSNPACAAQSIPDRLLTVKNIIRRRKAESRGLEYMASVLDPRKAEADAAVLPLLGRAIRSIILSDTSVHRVEGRFMLTPGEVDRLEDMLRGNLSRTLVSMPGGPLTLGMAVQSFRLEPFTTPSLAPRMFAVILNESVKRIAREEFLAREGYAKLLQNSGPVRHDVAAWRDNWLSYMMAAEAAPGAEPTEEEMTAGLIAYARLLSPGYEVNIREIYTDSLPAAVRYRDTLRTGCDMGALARAVSKRPAWAERSGESGFFRVRSFPELGVRALLADSGVLVGPVRVTGGYSLFRVLGKRRAEGDSSMTVDSLRKALHDMVRSEARQRTLDRFIAGLAEKFGVKLYYDRLKDVDVFSHPMFTRRYIGFGGMMNAAPLLKPEWGWVREYVASKNRVP